MRRLLRWFKWQNPDGTLADGGIMYTIVSNNRTLETTTIYPAWRFKWLVAWSDCWMGVRVDREKRKVYVFPLPCLGCVLYWGT